MPMFVDFARAFFPSNQIAFDFPTSFYGASSQNLSEEPPSINNIQVLSSMYSKYIKRKSSPATCNHYAALLTSACLDLMSRFWSLLIRFFREIRGSCAGSYTNFCKVAPERNSHEFPVGATTSNVENQIDKIQILPD